MQQLYRQSSGRQAHKVTFITEVESIILMVEEGKNTI